MLKTKLNVVESSAKKYMLKQIEYVVIGIINRNPFDLIVDTSF